MNRALVVAREQRARAEAALSDAEQELASVTRDRDLLIAASFRRVGGSISGVSNG